MSAGSPWPVLRMLAAAFEPVARLGQQAADQRRGLLVLEEVGAVQALLQGVDDRHRRLFAENFRV